MPEVNGRLGLVEMDISKLHGAQYNPRRKMTDGERSALNHSIDKFGLVQNIVVNMHPGREYTIISGHQRVETLKQLGVKRAMVKTVDLDVMREKRLNIAMNGIRAGWDNVRLQEMLDDFELDDLLDVGFTDTEAQSFIAKLFEYPHEGHKRKEQVGHEDKPPKPPVTTFTCPSCGFQGTAEDFVNPDAITHVLDIKEPSDEDIS